MHQGLQVLHANMEDGPRNPAPKDAAMYMSAPTMVPTTRLTTSRNPSERFNPDSDMSLIPVIFQLPLVLLPVHIVFLEIIIDPACSIVFEAEPAEEGVMKKPPRSLTEPLFDRKTIGFSIIQGLSVLLIVLSVFVLALYTGMGELDARTLSFTTLIIANIGLIFTNLSWLK